MFNLLYKELRLAAHPNLFVFAALGVLVMVPAYPYGMVFMFGCLAPFVTFMYGRETNDLYYTALLPIRKRDAVRAKCLLLTVTQMVQLFISLPFAFLRVHLLPEGNPAGIEANAAYYGFGLIIYAVFNFLFVTQFFKTAYKSGRAFLLAAVPAGLLTVTMEVAVHFPQFAWLDSVSPEMQTRQLPILLAGLAAYRVGAKRFERVDL